jgi:membrane-anchored mycosin MYCP
MSRLTTLSCAGLLASCLVVAGPAPAYAETDTDCTTVTTDTVYESPVGTTRASLPFTEMGVDHAWDRLDALGKEPGEGVVVAVLDSGVVPETGIPLAGHLTAGSKAPPAYYHGTAVAGLIAGPPRPDGDPVGIAPAAQVLDVQVYDDPSQDASDDNSPLTPQNVVDGLDQVIASLGTYNIKVVTIALQLPDDPAVRERVERLWDLGVVVVAPSGNRPGKDDGLPALIGEEYAAHRPGEDAAALIHPADYANVLAVSSTMTGAGDDVEATEYVLENSQTDIAAPSAMAVSYSVQGGTCFLTLPATSWAAAEVSGVLALLFSAYDDNPSQAVSRLRYTAAGRPDMPNTLVGAGEVQAFQALTRPIEMDEEGTVLSAGEVVDEPQVLRVPDEPEDVLASTRENAVWWGLVGGGALLLALVLRPVLARRRRTSAH